MSPLSSGHRDRRPTRIPKVKQLIKDGRKYSVQRDSGSVEGIFSNTGELVFGGIDKNHYTDCLVDVPLTSETYWEVSLDARTFGGSPIVHRDGVVEDGLKASVDALSKQVGAPSILGKEYVVDCSRKSTLPDFKVTLGGTGFTWTADDSTRIRSSMASSS